MMMWWPTLRSTCSQSPSKDSSSSSTSDDTSLGSDMETHDEQVNQNSPLSSGTTTGRMRTVGGGFLLILASALLGVFLLLLSSSSSSSTQNAVSTEKTVTHTDRKLEQTSDRELQNGPFLYSKMATIVPDPEHPVSDKALEEAKEKFGWWHFWDGDEDTRPKEDYCGKFPNRDVTEFPEGSWQEDAVYVNHFLNDAEELVGRTMEAIFTEYGWGISQWPADKKAWVLSERLKMYHWEHVKDIESEDFQPPEKYRKRGSHGDGGWTTERSFQGLVRRLLHAMMTNDEFVVVMGGHSSAAGHGNHFRQSYMMQFHKIMAPVFARLGVKLVTRNLAQGGLGTIQKAMGMKSLYGDSIDLLIWDSAMTEGNQADIEYFLRQGLLSGKKVPVLWGGYASALQFLHNHVDADIGVVGTGLDAIPVTENEDQAKTIPYAARGLKCKNERRDLCKERFCATCWVDRDDVPRERFKKISEKVGSQVRWHAGFREHQLKGRVLALSILDALQAAIQIFSDGTQGGPPLDEGEWHVTEYYENIRNKLKDLDEDAGYCPDIEPRLPKRLCKTSMEGRSLYTPRFNPHESSLLTIVKGPEEDKPKQTRKVLYEGDDVHNECYDTQEGAVDVLAVAGARRHLSTSRREVTLEEPRPNESHRALAKDDIALGKEWELAREFPGDCDGEYNSICGRHYEHNCPMLGNHDSRGALSGKVGTGWMVFNVPKVEEGLILMKMDAYVHHEEERLLRAKQVNVVEETDDIAERDYIDGHSGRRRLDLESLPDSFQLDYAIDGKVTTYSKEQLSEQLREVQRVVSILVLVDDPGFVKENVEVAIRIRGCGDDCILEISHMYWK